jgi:hypothetical protein
MTDDEAEFFKTWRGRKTIVESVAEAVDYVQKELDPR